MEREAFTKSDSQACRLNVIRYMFLMPAEDEEKIGISRAISVTLAVCAAAVLLLGIAPSALITWATESAQFLTRL